LGSKVNVDSYHCQVLCGLVAADVARQAWLAQAGALPMLQRLTLGQAAARQRAVEAADSGGVGGSDSGDDALESENEKEAAAPMSLGLRKQVRPQEQKSSAVLWSQTWGRCPFPQDT